MRLVFNVKRLINMMVCLYMTNSFGYPFDGVESWMMEWSQGGQTGRHCLMTTVEGEHGPTELFISIEPGQSGYKFRIEQSTDQAGDSVNVSNGTVYTSIEAAKTASFHYAVDFGYL